VAAALAGVLACLGLTGASWARADAASLIQQGRYVEAYDAVHAVDTAEAQVQAAVAASDQAVYVSHDDAEALAWLQRARSAAERAIALDPGDASAYVQLARARGEIGRRGSALEQMNTPAALKDLFDRALELEPDNADALVGLAMWNLELVRRGVGWLYGAQRERVVPLLERGVAAAPERVNLRVEYATALIALEMPQAAEEQLAIALALPATSAADRYEQQRARELRASAGG